MIATMLGLLILLLIGMLGWAAGLLLHGSALHWAERAGLSFAAGYGLLGVLLFDSSCCGLIPNRVMLVVVGCAAVTVLFWLRRDRNDPKLPRPGQRRGTLQTSLLVLSVGVVLAAGLNVLAQSLSPGLADIDMFGIWMFRAKLLATQALLPIPAALTDPTLSYSHQDYPMGMPMVVAAVYAMLGRVDEHAAMAALLLPIWFALTAVLYGALRNRVSRPIAAAVTAVFVASPVVVQHAGLAVAELPLVLMHACTLVLLVRWMESGRRSELVAAAAFAAFTAFMKNEGLALLPMVMAVGLVWSFLRRQDRWLRDWLLAVAVAVLLLGPWLVYRRWLPHTHEDYGGRLGSVVTLASSLPRVGSVFRHYTGYLWDVGTAGPIWLLLLLTAVIYRRGWAEGRVRLLWVLLGAHWALYLVIFTITPWRPEELMPMVAPKLLMHVAPAAVLLIGLHVSPSATGS